MANQGIQGLTVVGNTIHDTQLADGSYAWCIASDRVRQLFVGQNLCQNTGSVAFVNVLDVTVDGLTLETIYVESRGGAVALGPYADLVQLRNVEVRDVLDSGCFYFAGRLRDFQASNLTCERASSAIRTTTVGWWPGQFGPSDAIHLDGFSFVEIHGSSALSFPLGLEYSSFQNGEVAGYNRYGITVGNQKPFNFNAFRQLDIDQLFPAHLGNAFVADLGSAGWVCDAGSEGSFVTVLDTSNVDCATPGSSAAICYCDGASWQFAKDAQLDDFGNALRLTGGTVFGNVVREIVVRTTKNNSAILLGSVASGNIVEDVRLEDTAIVSQGENLVSGLRPSQLHGRPSVADCWIVTAAAGPDDCPSGGGGARNLCCWDGAAWDGGLGHSGVALAGMALDSTGASGNAIRNVECYRTSMAPTPCQVPAEMPRAPFHPSVPALGSWARALVAVLVVGLGVLRTRRLHAA